MKKLFLLIVSVVLLSACAGPPSHYRVNLLDDTLRRENGIVFGRMTQQRFFGLFMYNIDESGHGIRFKNLNTGEDFTYIAATYFEMMLPPGNYVIDGIGAPSGLLYPEAKPFTFTVSRGDVKYLGSVVGDRDLLRLLKKKNIPESEAYCEVISYKKYGPIDYFIVDEDEMVIDEFLQRHSEINRFKIRKDFMN